MEQLLAASRLGGALLFWILFGSIVTLVVGAGLLYGAVRACCWLWHHRETHRDSDGSDIQSL